MTPIDYIQEYIDKVERGELIVGKKVKQALERHQRDLERQNDPDFPFYYDPKEVMLPMAFISNLPDPKSGKPNQLASFQKFIIASIYGWRRKKNGARRYRKCYISLGRKQGKSLLVSGLAIYELLMGKNPSASRQVYAAANSKDQARIVFNMVKTQMKSLRARSKKIANFTKVNRLEILTEDESFMKPLSSDADSLDGLDTLLGILDEYGMSKNTEMIDVLETSQSQQEEPLIVIISTATSLLNAPMHAIEYPYITKILNQEAINDEYFIACYEQDSLAEADNPELWIKSCPLMEFDFLKEQLTEHKQRLHDESKIKGTLSNFLTKELNYWVASSEDSYMDKYTWESAIAKTQYDIRGRDVYIGVDLSRVNDLTSLTWVIPIDEEQKLYVDSHSWVGARNGILEKEKNDKTPYREFECQGYVTITSREDGMVDYRDMLDYLRDFIHTNELNVKGIYYDPYNSGLFITELSSEYDRELVEVRQGALTLNAPTKQLKVDVISGKVVHANNPILNRAMYNGIVKETNDNIQINKAHNRNKIDPLDALINAYVEAMYHDFNAVSLQEMYDSGQFGFGI